MRASCCLLVALIGAAGCERGPVPPKRGSIAGTVTLNSLPVASGRIRFLAIDPAGLNVAADITAGKFSVAAEQGPTRGKYRVEFSVPSSEKRRIPDYDNPGKFVEEAAETLPPRYHRESKVVLDYDPDDSQPLSYQLTTP